MQFFNGWFSIWILMHLGGFKELLSGRPSSKPEHLTLSSLNILDAVSRLGSPATLTVASPGGFWIVRTNPLCFEKISFSPFHVVFVGLTVRRCLNKPAGWWRFGKLVESPASLRTANRSVHVRSWDVGKRPRGHAPGSGHKRNDGPQGFIGVKDVVAVVLFVVPRSLDSTKLSFVMFCCLGMEQRILRCFCWHGIMRRPEASWHHISPSPSSSSIDYDAGKGDYRC